MSQLQSSFGWRARSSAVARRTEAAAIGSRSPAAARAPRRSVQYRAGARWPPPSPSRSLDVQRRPQQGRQFFLHLDQGLRTLSARAPSCLANP